MKKKVKVVHISTVHSWQDPRIFLKECQSLAKNGFEVHLITPDGMDEVKAGVQIHRLNYQSKNRFFRFFKAPSKVFEQALSLQPDVIHFHDPELIPKALKVKSEYKEDLAIIYDIHEDNSTAIYQREYLPDFLKPVVVSFVKYLEKKASNKLSTIIAEQYYEKRFPAAVPVLNYPDLGWMEEEKIDEKIYQGLLYTGNVREDRGALNHAKILSYTQEVELWSIGRCTSALYSKMKATAGEGSARLIAEGVDRYVPFNAIIEKYKSRNWLAGLAIFPYSEHVKEKQLTKFFEYMAAGIPIIYSDFPEWRKFLEPLDVGIAVNPEKDSEILAAVELLQSNVNLWREKSRNGQKKVKDFKWESQGEILFNMYESITE